jgi:RNA polymerase sigma-54 factor
VVSFTVVHIEEIAALADDPTQHADLENRFDSSIADMPRSDTASRTSSSGDFDILDNIAQKEGFYPFLFKQLNLTFTKPSERMIATHFINAEAEDILLQLQQFEPAGLFARDLAECLRLQLIDQESFTPLFGALLDNLDQLGRGEIRQLARKLKCDYDDILDMLAEIRTLNPKPGEHLGIEYREMPSPDVIVTRKPDGWSVELNRSTLPAILVNETYAEMLAEKRQSIKEQDYSADTLSNARWLKRAVEQRNQTTLKISAEIIRHQKDFLEKGLDYLKPLSLRDVAQAVGMHESTVSRVTTGLLISTPRGCMPLKSFFSVNIASRDSDINASAASVRNMVKKIISTEVPGKPLSDEAISKIISQQGIDLARRTVAKYREMLNIPSSSQRRMQARLSDMR